MRRSIWISDELQDAIKAVQSHFTHAKNLPMSRSAIIRHAVLELHRGLGLEETTPHAQ